jgi:glycosyltransferase involved in cell wall biosynthesis
MNDQTPSGFATHPRSEAERGKNSQGLSKQPGLIGFDVTALAFGYHSGVGRYTRQLLAALIDRHDGHRYALLANKPVTGALPSGAIDRIQRRTVNRTWWLQFVAPRTIAQLQPEVCHFTNVVAPLNAPCPIVVTIHDAAILMNPQWQPLKSLLAVRAFLPQVARRADAIITVSHSARRDLISYLRLPPEKVRVVYEAAAPHYRPIENATEIDRVQRHYELHKPFALYVGTIEPRKNLDRLVQAFARVQTIDRDQQLILIGQQGWKYQAVLKQIEDLGLQNRVRLLGYVPDEDLPAIYTLANFSVYPSLYEGFGLPIIESMACGTPVLTSDRSSMAELGADAALLIDPLQVDSLADGWQRLLTDAALHAKLRAAGLRRAAEFSWSRAAAETVEVYASIGSSTSR